jgi:hypothetical protein
MSIVVGFIAAMILSYLGTVSKNSMVPNSVKELEWRRAANRKGTTGTVISLVFIGTLILVGISLGGGR